MRRLPTTDVGGGAGKYNFVFGARLGSTCRKTSRVGEQPVHSTDDGRQLKRIV